MKLFLIFITLSMSVIISCSNSGENHEIISLKGEWTLTQEPFAQTENKDEKLIIGEKILQQKQEN